ncbi:MAG: type II secretion system protein J [Pirellulales bacterium]
MSASKQNDRRGMTLIEMLIATAVSLILMAAVAQVFAAFSGAMSNGRSILETDSRLRNVARRLRDDLNGATTQMLPPRTPDQGEGYFEIIEGPINDLFGYTSEDLNANGTFQAGAEETGDGTGTNRLNANANGVLDVPALKVSTDLSGDIDDVLLFTTLSKTTPFVGRSPTGTFESQTAEVAWFVRPTSNTSNPQTYTLYRKQLLVMGYVGAAPFSTNNQMNFPGTWSGYFGQPCDIRRATGAGQWGGIRSPCSKHTKRPYPARKSFFA